MPLEDYLEPGERVLFEAPVAFGSQRYTAYLTDRSLILFAQRGLVFKKDDIIALKLKDIDAIKFKEEGIINKRGVLVIEMGRRKVALTGHPADMRRLWMQIQK